VLKRPMLVKKIICSLPLSAFLFYPAISYCAPLPSIDAGQVLRDSQHMERSLPSSPFVNIDTGREIKPPMNNQQDLKVNVKGYRLVGQDIFSQEALLPLLASYSNRELSFADLQQAAAAVTAYFRSQGYLMAQAYLPAQEMADGTVEIQVIVGRYGDILVKNSTTLLTDDAIKAQMTALRPGAYITSASLERAVLLVNDLSGVKAKVRIVRGKTAGTSDVVLEVADTLTQVSGMLNTNNWGNRFTGSNQAAADVFIASPAHRGDGLSLNITNAGSGLTTGGINYQMPVGEGSHVTVSYSKVNYELGKDFANANAYGDAMVSHIDWSHALKRSRDSNLRVKLGYDHKEMNDHFNSSNAYRQSNAVNLTLAGDSVDAWGGGGVTGYAVDWHRGDLSGQSLSGAALSGNWQKMDYNVNRQQRLNERLSLQLLLSGQFANTNLDSSEKFSLGGANGVRAYPSNEGSGDEGWLFTGELRWTLPVKNSEGILQAAAFFDAGGSKLEKNPTGAGDNTRNLSAYGLGLLWTKPGDYSVKTYYAWKAGHEAAKSDQDKSGRFWLQIAKSF